MVKSGVLLIARKIVGDGAVIRRVPGQGIQMFRKPEPGELSRRYEATLQRLKVQHKDENLVEVASAEALERVVRSGEPAVIIGVEGGDFLEGDLKRLESARQQGIAHLQLVHYRVSELGDISFTGEARRQSGRHREHAGTQLPTGVGAGNGGVMPG